MNKIAASELVLNDTGRVYHLNLAPEELAENVILVGDPNRVPLVSKYFDSIEHKRSTREIHTHTGTYKGKKFSVISTGMGPDNIDIVLNELDALVNIDLKTRELKSNLTSLNIVRIGTSGALQENIPVDSFVLSRYGIGFDGVLHFYKSSHVQKKDIQDAFVEHSNWNPLVARPYVVQASEELFQKLKSDKTIDGFTATAIGFYGPQGRVLRMPLADEQMNEKLENFEYKNLKITNYEMETSAIFGLAAIMGHKACAVNCIIANRVSKTFSQNAHQKIEELIKYTLDKLSI